MAGPASAAPGPVEPGKLGAHSLPLQALAMGPSHNGDGHQTVAHDQGSGGHAPWPRMAINSGTVLSIAVAVGGAASMPCGVPGATSPCGSLALARDVFVAVGLQTAGVLGAAVVLGRGTFGPSSCNVTWPDVEFLSIVGAGPGATTVDCGLTGRMLRTGARNVSVTALALVGCASSALPGTGPALGEAAPAPDTLSGGCILVVWKDFVGSLDDRWVSASRHCGARVWVSGGLLQLEPPVVLLCI
jgi:hypothetical protein